MNEKDYAINVGRLLSNLNENQYYRELLEVEKIHIEDLKTKVTMLSINDPLYLQKSAFMNGMVEGLRRYRVVMDNYISAYRKSLKEEIKQHGTTTTK